MPGSFLLPDVAFTGAHGKLVRVACMLIRLHRGCCRFRILLDPILPNFTCCSASHSVSWHADFGPAVAMPGFCFVCVGDFCNILSPFGCCCLLGSELYYYCMEHIRVLENAECQVKLAQKKTKKAINTMLTMCPQVTFPNSTSKP